MEQEVERTSSFSQRIRGNKLLINSTIFSISNVLIGFFNYLFHLVMARMMDIKTYGEFETLVALLAIMSIPATTIVMVLTRYSAKFSARNEYEKIRYILSKSVKGIFLISLVIFTVAVIISPLTQRFIKLDSVVPIIILASLFVTMPLISIIRGVMQGLQKFWGLSLNTILEVGLKLIIAVSLISIGLSLNGAMLAITANVLIVYLVGLIQIKKMIPSDGSTSRISVKEKRGAKKYAIPVMTTMLFITLLFNIDLILVKHFFDPETAGMYGSLVVIGKIVFFVTGAVSAVMFPMLTEAKEKGNDYKKIFRNAGLLISFISLCFITACFVLPEFIISVLLGDKFIEASFYLGWYSIIMFLMSLINMGITYFLSLKKTKLLYRVGIGPVLIIIFISLFHDSIWQIISVLFVSMSLSLLVILDLFRKEKSYLPAISNPKTEN